MRDGFLGGIYNTHTLLPYPMAQPAAPGELDTAAYTAVYLEAVHRTKNKRIFPTFIFRGVKKCPDLAVRVTCTSTWYDITVSMHRS